MLPSPWGDLPGRASPLPDTGARDVADAVYFPSCVTRVPGLPRDEAPAVGLASTIVRVARPRRPAPLDPRDVSGTCCGMPYSSKGFEEAHAIAANRAIDRLFRWSDGGRLPVVVDSSPCAFALTTCRAVLDAKQRERFDAMRIEDAVGWAHDAMLPRLPLRRRVPRVAVHPVCSIVKMGLVPEADGDGARLRGRGLRSRRSRMLRLRRRSWVHAPRARPTRRRERKRRRSTRAARTISTFRPAAPARSDMSRATGSRVPLVLVASLRDDAASTWRSI